MRPLPVYRQRRVMGGIQAQFDLNKITTVMNFIDIAESKRGQKMDVLE